MTVSASSKPLLRIETSSSFAEAAAIIQAGGLIGFLTDTLYGLGADATNAEAVARVFSAKNRPPDKPLLVLVADMPAARDIAIFDDRAERLARTFWPGPLTLILPRSIECRLCAALNPFGETVSLRIPGRAATRDFLTAADRPLTAPSANPSGAPAPQTAAAAAAALGDRVDLILDGGAAKSAVPSTIIDLSGPTLRCVRVGAISEPDIAKIAG
jgi:L-threonylcarbamoyladenylate synthase